MAALDNLVVTTALPVIRASFGATLAELEWIVNAYTLTFAVLLLTGAALGDRFGRQARCSSSVSRSSPAARRRRARRRTSTSLIVARADPGPRRRDPHAAQPDDPVGRGAAGATRARARRVGRHRRPRHRDRPARRRRDRRGPRLAVHLLGQRPDRPHRDPAGRTRLTETHGPSTAPRPARPRARQRRPARGRVGPRPRPTSRAGPSPTIVASFVVGIVLLVAFVAWEARTAEPMLPLRLFASGRSRAANVVSLLMSFGMFGSIFLLAQFFQVVQHYSPLQAGLRTLPWTIMPIFVAPTRRSPVVAHRHAAAARPRDGADGRRPSAGCRS